MNKFRVTAVQKAKTKKEVIELYLNMTEEQFEELVILREENKKYYFSEVCYWLAKYTYDKGVDLFAINRLLPKVEENLIIKKSSNITDYERELRWVKKEYKLVHNEEYSIENSRKLFYKCLRIGLGNAA